MTETPQAPAPSPGPGQPPAAAAPPGDGPPPSAEGRSGWDTAGTVLMCVSVAGLVVILLDVAFKGRLLGPLLARLAPAAPPPADDQPPPPEG